jgi:ParB family chromosome partitioning protein
MPNSLPQFACALHQIVENWQRSDMHPYDLADALARLRDSNGYSQTELATATGKSKGEISKLLALLDLDADVQKIAREDQTGRITKRHLYAVRSLSAEDQKQVALKVQRDGMTTEETEALVEKKHPASRASSPRGAPLHRIRLTTSRATVLLTFRRKHVSDDDVLKALEEAQAQVSPKPEIRIVRGR